MKSLYQYLSENKKVYKFRIKTVTPLDDDIKEQIYDYLSKYDIKSMSDIRKSIIQREPLEFKDILYAEVYSIDVILNMPVSSYILIQELRSLLNIPEKYIVVRGENEPIELESQNLSAKQDIKEIKQKQDLSSLGLMSTGSEYPEAREFEVAYGDKYNNLLLTYLSNISSEREYKIANPDGSIVKQKMFSWLKDPETADDFNKEIDTVKPIHQLSKKDKIDKVNDTGIHGNYNDTVEVKKLFVNKNGDPIIISSKGN